VCCELRRKLSAYYEPTYLYLKSRYINEDHPNYAEQLNFDEQLSALNLRRL